MEEKKELTKEIKQNSNKTYIQKTPEELFLELIKDLKGEFSEDWLFYKNPEGKIIIEINTKNSIAYFDYISFWSKFYSRFDMDFNEVQEFTKRMLSTHMNINVNTTRMLSVSDQLKEIKPMKHSEIKQKIIALIPVKLHDLMTELKTGSISGMNYISIKFNTEEERDRVAKFLPTARKGEKRYGISLIVSEYTFKKL